MKWRARVGMKGREVMLAETIDLAKRPGLVAAELELAREDMPLERPAWVGEDVTTADARHLNASLIKVQFSALVEGCAPAGAASGADEGSVQTLHGDSLAANLNHWTT